MTTTALPAHTHLASDPQSHVLLDLIRSGYLAYGYDAELRPAVLLDGEPVNVDLTDNVTALWAWGLVTWDDTTPDASGALPARLTDLGKRALHRWNEQTGSPR